MKKSYFFKLILLSLTLVSCAQDQSYKEKIKDPELVQANVKNLTDIIVYDIFSPPVASRVYLYPAIAAYQTMQLANEETYASLSGQVKELEPLTKSTNENVNYNIASLHAFNEVGKALIFSEDKMNAFQENLDQQLKDKGVPRSVLKASKKFGVEVAAHILAWAKGDLYNQTRTFPKYTIQEEEHYWKPTPPDYMDGIEPHWKQIRTMALDSSNQFPPKPPLAFDLTEGSPFQIQLKEVYEIGKNITDEQLEIAQFWDCNPYVTHHRGHAMFATKKITPGGHWIGITSIATRKAKSDFQATTNAYANVTIALFDAFISCWDEKWNTLVVRPETLINKHYDEEWLPILQTPPFPEYTSGHSVISRAAAITLTDLFGDNFAFDDTTEIEYGLPVRSYDSFIEASEEAAVSRLYGGIHYMMAIEEGVAQGQEVGEHIVQRIQTFTGGDKELALK
ncbi:MAG: phosphatidic acid phosphatase [Candidatus Arcticimaribacter sp.]|nr:MAG: phosphatidic acid phosphatase [Candidatus Arcticimaribacter sp.]PTL98634.1 MAG: phosphatidic acid phosphatase [Candidatus Arcticimaribacter sp.]